MTRDTKAQAPDTIVAPATPPGRGGIGVVRLSGPSAERIGSALAGPLPPPRLAKHRRFRDAHGEVLDTGLALRFPAPHSYTGEDVVELHGHGSPVVLDALIEASIAHGARLARPGEFTERAFLNGKLDLAQAEAVADLIDAGSRAAARGALHSLEGQLSKEVDTLAQALVAVRTYVEASIDFPEEDDAWLAEGGVSERLAGATEALERLRAGARQGVLLQEGLRVVLAGRPNVGKSSLLNALARRDAALVTALPGTTRDVIREPLNINGVPVLAMDTAGLRDTEDPIERLGAERTLSTLAQADVVLLVISDAEGAQAADWDLLAKLPEAAARLVVLNKVDLTGRTPGRVALDGPFAGLMGVALSAKDGGGLDVLRAEITRQVGYEAGEGSFLARRRHLEAVDEAGAHLARASEALGAPEIAAEELRLAHEALARITGRFTTEDLLGAIFSSFCIGK